VLGAAPDRQAPETIAEAKNNEAGRLLIVEDRWIKRMSTALTASSQPPLPSPSGCVSAYNVMRGCPVYFRIYDMGGAPPCQIPSEFACQSNPHPAGPQKSGNCD
jgi:hypothetical protein